MNSKLSKEVIDAFIFISQREYHCGVISFADLIEREDILAWLIGKSQIEIDPRFSPERGQIK